MKTLAIIGANGYVGQHLLKVLAPHYQVTALYRGKRLLDKALPNVTYSSVADCKQTFDILINTAYNLSATPQQISNDNESLLVLIKKLSTQQTHIIHLSSIAVFGFGLDKPIEAKAVKTSNDYNYVFSKVDMENRLLQAFKADNLSIIRLGNVWGAANNSWTQPIADAITWHLPVLSKEKSYANIAFIDNISNYILYVIACERHLTFHHLAEFNAITWQQVIEELSAYIGKKAMPIQQVPFYPTSLWQELKLALSPNVFTVLKRLKTGRFTSRYFPQHLFMRVQQFIAYLKPNKQKTPKLGKYQIDDTFYWVLSLPIPFRLHILDGWTAPYKWEDCMEQTKNWLQEAGYINEPNSF